MSAPGRSFLMLLLLLLPLPPTTPLSISLTFGRVVAMLTRVIGTDRNEEEEVGANASHVVAATITTNADIDLWEKSAMITQHNDPKVRGVTLYISKFE